MAFSLGISSSVLNRYENLIHNSIIPLFLTMLVGAGGNAGNQVSTSPHCLARFDIIPRGSLYLHPQSPLGPDGFLFCFLLVQIHL